MFVDGGLPENSAGPLAGLPWDRRRLAFRCDSGGRIEGEWTGVPVGSLIAAADVSDAMTHLLVDSVEEYRACVPLRDSMDALLAFRESRTDCEATAAVTPRLVGPRIDSARAVKRVDRIRAIQLRPEEDATEYEHLPD